MDCSSFSKTLAAWGLPETLLGGIDPDARPLLWRELRAVLEARNTATCTAGGSPTGAGRAPREPLPFVYQHYARPRFQQRNLRELNLTDWHRTLRLALWMAAEALEAFCALPRAEEYRTLLASSASGSGSCMLT